MILKIWSSSNKSALKIVLAILCLSNVLATTYLLVNQTTCCSFRNYLFTIDQKIDSVSWRPFFAIYHETDMVSSVGSFFMPSRGGNYRILGFQSNVVCRQMFTNQCIGYKQTGLGKIDFLIDFLTILMMFSPICFTNFSQFERLKRENKLLICPKQYHYQFASWKRNHNKY